MYHVVLKPYKHLGDHVALTSVLYNLKKLWPENDYGVHERCYAQYSGVFLNNPNIRQSSRFPRMDIFCDYGSDQEKYTGPFGLFMNGFNHMAISAMNKLYHTDYAYSGKNTADFYIAPEEYQDAPVPNEPYCLINCNCQTVNPIKGYPFWQDIVDACPGITFVQIGNDSRDISMDVSGTVDLRGKTTARQLILLASKAACIIAGPTGLIHIGSAFPSVKKIVLLGGRESVKLWEYENTVCLCSSCGEFGGSLGCGRGQFGPEGWSGDDLNSGKPTKEVFSGWCGKSCDYKGRRFASCMSAIPPEQIAEEINKCLGK